MLTRTSFSLKRLKSANGLSCVRFLLECDDRRLLALRRMAITAFLAFVVPEWITAILNLALSA